MHIQIYTRTKFEGLRRMDLHYMLTGLKKALHHADGRIIQEIPQRNFFISVAFILHFVKSKYRSNNIGEIEDNEAQVQSDDT